MGLVISHGGYEGGYMGFSSWRAIVAQAHGGSWPPHNFPVDRRYQTKKKGVSDKDWVLAEGCDEYTHPGLFALLGHSDCDGTLTSTECMYLAEELEALLPAIEVFHRLIPGSGHIQRQGGFLGVTNNMIEACREAHDNDEELRFA